MAGGGSIQGMKNSLNNNSKLLRRKKLFKNENIFLKLNPNNMKGVKGGIPSEQIAAEDLHRIKEKIKKEKTNERRKLTYFLIIAVPFIAAIGYFSLKDFSFFNNYTAATEKITVDLTKKYLFYLNDGDKWLDKKHYHNAIFQYKKALELYPTEYDALYRLALGYSYQCQYQFKGCNEGMALVQRLEKQFPTSEEITNVKMVFEHWGAK